MQQGFSREFKIFFKIVIKILTSAMADAFMTFMVNFTGYYPILTMTRGG